MRIRVELGVLLQEPQNFAAWRITPGIDPLLFIIVTVLMFNFLGDGLRDAADPSLSRELKYLPGQPAFSWLRVGLSAKDHFSRAESPFC